MDFILKTYQKLLIKLREVGYSFITFEEYLTSYRKQSNNIGESQSSNPDLKLVILRHDVDALPLHSLRMAQLENSLGIKGTYYFRMVPKCFKPEIILEIASMGHEVGYHYETLSEAVKRYRTEVRKHSSTNPGIRKQRNNSQDQNRYWAFLKPATRTIFCRKKDCGTLTKEYIDLAYQLFIENLENFRKVVSVKTISMHGSPLSPFDNRAIWKEYDYRELGILGEPYFDSDFSKMAYLTDTSRWWNGYKFNLRDKVKSSYSFGFISTYDIIRNLDQLPNQIMFNFHPQRWTDSFFPWVKELIWQNVKNIVKWLLLKWKKLDEDV